MHYYPLQIMFNVFKVPLNNNLKKIGLSHFDSTRGFHKAQTNSTFVNFHAGQRLSKNGSLELEFQHFYPSPIWSTPLTNQQRDNQK